ncbi:hypothetical protein TorRG33x02_062980 [Trema orientale]|uniref:Uncharacterized protein n=1 Tax=Trema orientale TaxID=63057 RepID=A0A2P5FJN1_TREOI|nr:hypothetical protein TorRG33x02_062980 [Trema orientale]
MSILCNFCHKGSVIKLVFFSSLNFLVWLHFLLRGGWGYGIERRMLSSHGMLATTILD